MIPVLITGGAGNIASHLANKLLATNKYQVVVVDNLTTGDIHKISIVQTKPSAATNEGIYQISSTANPNTMKYEVVITSVGTNVPPTPEKGFGSTNGGALSTTNVQTFVKK